MSTYCRRTASGCGCPFCFGCGWALGVGTTATTTHVLISVTPSRRQIRVSGMRLTRVRSVFWRGSVQSSSTPFPTRVAVKSSTGRASCSDGSCGAPGVPHPENPATAIKLPISQRRSLMETNRVTNSKAPPSSTDSTCAGRLRLGMCNQSIDGGTAANHRSRVTI